MIYMLQLRYFTRNIIFKSRLTGRRPIARTVGTTVRVEGLFEVLPVRRGDFVRWREIYIYIYHTHTFTTLPL